MEKKSFLFIFKTAPFENSNAKEGMDFAFSCAAFEQKVDAIFVDDGLFLLVKNQDSSDIGLKNHAAAIEAFDLYGIDNCYYDGTTLTDRGLSTSQFIGSANEAPLDIWQTLSQYDYIFSY